MTQVRANLTPDLPTVNLETFFSIEDTSQNLEQFANSVGTDKKQTEITYYWPTEIDPQADGVIEWALANSETLFPNLVNEDKQAC